MLEETDIRGESTKKLSRRVSFAPIITHVPPNDNDGDDDGDDDDNVDALQRQQLLSAMKGVMRGKGQSTISLPRVERPSGLPSPGAVEAVRADSPDVPLAKTAGLLAESGGPLRFIAFADRSRPPLWLRRWADLFLFRNATRAFTSAGGAALDAAVAQLSGDVAAAQAQSVPAAGDEAGEEVCVLAADPPLWRRAWARAALTRRLAESLAGHLAALRAAAGPVGAAEFGGADGAQRSRLCPLLQRVHGAVVAGALLDDVFMRREAYGGGGGRARRIEAAYREHMPRVHADFVTEERANSAYDPNCLGAPRNPEGIFARASLSSPLASFAPQAERCLLGQSAFTVHIDYVRFRPSSGSATRAQRIETSVSAVAGFPKPMSPIDPQAQRQRGVKPVVMFSPEEELISRILDNYEPYRMMQLSLLPGIKSRSFYEDQLRTLQHQPHQSEDLRGLIATLKKLHRATAELERHYTRAMLNAWQELAALRGDRADPVVPMPLQTVNTSTTERLVPAPSRGAVPQLLDNNPGQSARFRWYLCRHGSVVPGAYAPGDDFVDDVPVVEGAGAMPLGDGQSLFQVLVFARTSAMIPPQFVGATAPRALSAAKVLFINETFKLRATHEPLEILLHILPVSDSVDLRVISTVCVRPSQTYAHRLLPLEAPVTFTHRNRTHSRHNGDAIHGVVSLTTKWTPTQDMTFEEIEDIFLRGDADPRDPQHESLFGILRTYYATAPHAAVPDPSPKEARLHHYHRVPQPLPVPHSGEAGGERAALLLRRWLVRDGLSLPSDASEAQLFGRPLPADETECCALLARARRDAAARGADDAGSDEEFGTRAVALSPLPRSAKLELWRRRLRAVVTRRQPMLRQEDHEALERLVAMPRLRLRKFSIITPERHLKPRRESHPKAEEINRDELLSRQDSRILVHIMKATALPRRADGTPLEPFVEVRFVYETVHSRSEIGSAPAWFETLEIPFCPPDFDNETLSVIEDDIVIALYDKVEIPMARTTATTGAVAHETHYRTERRLLGTLRVPFFSLYEADQARMEGQYALETPRWLLGYQPVGVDGTSSSSFPPRRTHSVTGTEVAAVACPSVQLYIALSPPLRRDARRELDHPTISRLVAQLNVSAQLQHLHNVAICWRRDVLGRIKGLSSVNPIAKQREIEPFVFSTTGDLTLACRYLNARGGPPPLGVRSPQEAIRFVSLLPFRMDTLTWGGEDVWSTHVELLSTRAGDYEELSLLLAHFLRYLEPDEVTMIVTGRGTVHHHIVMVLHSFSGELRLIDPRTGIVCPVHDPHIPTFRDVHMVISHDQLWANVQLSGAPHRMGWNLQDQRLWSPCFDQSDADVRACLPFIATLQRETLTFAPPDANKVTEIEQQLRKAVRKSLVTWRNNRHPALHNGVASVLCELLKEAERERYEHASVLQEEVTAKATELVNEHFCEEILQDPCRGLGRRTPGAQDHSRPRMRMMGCPVNDAYRPDDIGFQEILQRVFETAVHEAGTNAVSFAIGVYVKGYTSDVYSMWVFLAALYEVSAPPPTYSLS